MLVELDTHQLVLQTGRKQLVLWQIRITDLQLQDLLTFQGPEIISLKILHNRLDLKLKKFVLFVIIPFCVAAMSN